MTIVRRSSGLPTPGSLCSEAENDVPNVLADERFISLNKTN